MFMSMEGGRNNGMFIDDGDPTRGSTTRVCFAGATTMGAFDAIGRAVEENEGVSQSLVFGVRQAGVKEV
jgi:hypothetical protein